MIKEVWNNYIQIILSLLLCLIFFPNTYAENVKSGSEMSRSENHRVKQRESVTSGACVIESGSFPVGFNAYVIPEGNHPSYPPFCSPVPAGRLDIVIDLFSDELRDRPIAIKIVKIEKGEEHEISSLPPSKYTNGSIPLQVLFEPSSKYKILLFEKNANESIDKHLVTIPLDVRRKGDYVHTGATESMFGFLFVVFGIVGLIVLIYRYLFNDNVVKVKK